MIRLIRSIILTLAVFSGWLTTLVVAAPVHSLVFRQVAPDGAIAATERVAFDRNISSYLITGNEQDLNALQPIELIHMQDVRQLYLWLVCMTMLFIALAVVTYAWRGAVVAFSLTSVIGVLSLLSFQKLFELFHQLVYTNDAWILDPAQFMLTQVYPLGFFIWMWGIVSFCSILTLGVFWQRLRHA